MTLQTSPGRGLYGALPARFLRFEGLVLDSSPIELPPELSPLASNWDCDGSGVGAKRKGRVAYNSSAPTASRVWGLFPYYPPAANRIPVMQAGTAIYADNNRDGDFADAGESLATGLTGGRPCDFLQWKDVLYAGNGIDALRKATFSAGILQPMAAVAVLGAPAAAAVVAGVQTQLEAFDSGTWTLSAGAALSTATYATDISKDNTSFKVTASGSGARGAYLHKTWSSGATVDLSKLTSIVLWVYADKARISFQVAVKDNAGALAFDRFPIHTITTKKTWQRIVVPLAGIAPGSRTASTGLAIKYIDDGDAAFPNILYFDDAKGLGPFEIDEWDYWYTYAVVDANGIVTAESNPYSTGTAPGIQYPAAAVTVTETTPYSGINVTVVAGGAPTNKIRLYRKRKNGVMRRARLVASLANSSATYLDQRSDEDLLVEDADELVLGRTDPPKAYTYALSGSRMWAGNVALSGTQYPWRLYCSRLGFPEEFNDAQIPLDPNSAGWVDIPTKDHILRILDWNGMLLIFCNRSLWTLQGSGWDDFSLQKRADVGLDAREAVAALDAALLFLAADGVRVLVPNMGFEGSFETWVVSEGVTSRLRQIPAGLRPESAMGVDEDGRVHLSLVRSGQTAPDAALVFDPRRPGATAQGYNPLRPGWTEYRWPAGAFSCYAKLKEGGGDYGQLLAGDYSTGKVFYLRRDGAGAYLETDDAGAIAWSWQSAAADAGAGSRQEWSYVAATFEQGATGLSVTLTPVLDGVASGTTYTQTGSIASTAGLQTPTEKRTACGIRGRFGALKLSGSHSAAFTVRSVEYGRYVR